VIDDEEESIDFDEYFDIYFEEIGKRMKKLSREEAKESKFAGYDCIQTDYTASILTESVYGSVYALHTKGKSIFFVKQTDTENRLKKNFEIIENSFKVEDSVHTEVIVESIEE